MPFQIFVKNPLTAVQTVVHRSLTNAKDVWNAFLIPSHADERNPLMADHAADHAACMPVHTPDSHDVNDAHSCRPVSVCVKK